jgi:hypothetical protein
MTAPVKLRRQERELWQSFEKLLLADSKALATSSRRATSVSSVSIDDTHRHAYAFPNESFLFTPPNITTDAPNDSDSKSSTETVDPSPMQTHTKTDMTNIARRLRVIRAKRYALYLDWSEWNMNFTMLGGSLRWFQPPRYVTALCGVIAGGLGLYRLWLTAYANPTKPAPTFVSLMEQAHTAVNTRGLGRRRIPKLSTGRANQDIPLPAATREDSNAAALPLPAPSPDASSKLGKSNTLVFMRSIRQRHRQWDFTEHHNDHHDHHGG